MKAIPLLAAALLLASCARQEPAAPVADNEQERAALPAAEQAAPAATPAAGQPAPLTSEGWGPLRIGMTLKEVTKALGPDSDPQAPGGPEPEHCDQFRPDRAPPGMLVMIEEGILTRISLMKDSPLKTDRGFGVGASAAQVASAYGAAATASPHKYRAPPPAYVTVWTKGGAGKAYVQDPAARGLVYEVDEAGTVSMIHAGGPSIQYVEGCA